VRATASAPPDTALGRTLVLFSVILATTLYATTLTIANVALPQMQGNDLARLRCAASDAARHSPAG
jgi:hypothetical protein